METFGVSLNAEGTCFYGMQVQRDGEWGRHRTSGPYKNLFAVHVNLFSEQGTDI